MNDIRFQIEVSVGHVGGLVNVDLADLHHELNRTPFSAVGYRYAVEGSRDYLARP